MDTSPQLFSAQERVRQATARAEKAEAAIERVRVLCRDRYTLGHNLRREVRVDDVLAELGIVED